MGAGVGRLFTPNPDISFIGDFTFLGTEIRQRNKANRFSFREAELGFQARSIPTPAPMPSSPSARASPRRSRTLTRCPHSAVQSAGRGSAVSASPSARTISSTATPSTDRPAARPGGQLRRRGLLGTGLGASDRLPTRWDEYLRLTAEVVNGLGEEPQGAQGIPLEQPAPGRSLGDFVYVGHAQSFFDLNDDNNIELGGSILANALRHALQHVSTGCT